MIEICDCHYPPHLRVSACDPPDAKSLEIRRLKAAMIEAAEVMGRAKVFVFSNNRIKRPEGEEWYGDAIKTLRDAVNQ